MSEDDKSLTCPACVGFSMRKYSAIDVGTVIDRCTKCKGMWFDGGEISEFLQSDQLKANFMGAATGVDGSADVDRKCPRCEVVMARPIIGGVTVDVCGSCSGVWLDQGELDSLVHAYETQDLKDDGVVVAEIQRGLETGEMSDNVLSQLAASVKNLVAKVRSPKAAAPDES